MKNVLDRLILQTKRESTDLNYLGIWRKFNNFVVQLDHRPGNWEDRIQLYAAYLVDEGIQSSTLRCYYSTIKSIIKEDGYILDDNRIIFNSLVRACRLKNDRVVTRLPIRHKLLELLLFEVQRIYESQPYLETLYKTMFVLAYYGLFHIGELATGSHPIKASDVHIAQNKDKMLFILYSSKTHGKESHAQRVKITGNENTKIKRFFCPFKVSREYLVLRGNYHSDNDPFFVLAIIHQWDLTKLGEYSKEPFRLLIYPLNVILSIRFR